MAQKKFEEALEQLEWTIEQLEKKELALDESLKLFQEGIKLYRYCNKKINDVELKIKMIIEEDDEIKQLEGDFHLGGE